MPSRAMQPAIEPGDTLFVSKFAYGFRLPWSLTRVSESPPQYGDVAVLEFSDEPGREYIKRIVGLPGDTVQLSKSFLILNGKTVTENPKGEALCTEEILPNLRTYPVCFEPPLLSIENAIQVPEGEVFVVGDLRTSPNDIRKTKTQGLVPITHLHGRAKFVWLSIQPPTSSSGGEWFSRIRLNRVFKGIQ